MRPLGEIVISEYHDIYITVFNLFQNIYIIIISIVTIFTLINFYLTIVIKYKQEKKKSQEMSLLQVRLCGDSRFILDCSNFDVLSKP